MVLLNEERCDESTNLKFKTLWPFTCVRVTVSVRPRNWGKMKAFLNILNVDRINYPEIKGKLDRVWVLEHKTILT